MNTLSGTGPRLTCGPAEKSSAARWSSGESGVVWAHLHSLSTEDVLMQGRDKDFRQMVDVVFGFLTTLLHTAGHALQRLC